MRKFIGIMLCAVALTGVNAQAQVSLTDNSTFEDANFRAYLATNKNVDKNVDGVLSPAEISSVKVLNLSMKQITSLKGIEVFQNLEDLSVDYNKITSFEDIKGLTNLKKLTSRSNAIGTIDDIKGLSNLESLTMASSGLTGTIDFTIFPKLTYIDVSSNSLTGIVLANDETVLGLTSLNVSYNKNLQTLDVTKNTGLESLNCAQCGLSELDVDPLINLINLNCEKNSIPELKLHDKLVSLNCKSNKIKVLDTTPCGASLKILKCSSNRSAGASAYDMNIVNNLRVNPNLENLEAMQCALENFDVSGNPALKTLIVGQNKTIKSLNLENNEELETLSCETCDLSELNLEKNTKLTSLQCQYNKISALDVSKNTLLKTLMCSVNKLKKLDVSTNTELTKLLFANNNINSIDLTKNTKLVNPGATDVICRPNGRIVKVHKAVNGDNPNQYFYYISKDEMVNLIGENTGTTLGDGGFDAGRITATNAEEYKVEEGDIEGLAAGTTIYKLDETQTSYQNSGYKQMTYSYDTKFTGAGDQYSEAFFYLDWSPLEADVTTSIDTLHTGVKVWGGEGRLNVDGASHYAVYNLNGVEVYRGGESTIELPQGVYLVKVANKTHKVMVK